MLAHLDLHAGHVHPVDVPRVPLASRIAVFVRLVNQAHGHAALDRSDRRIGVPLVGNPIHDDVDLLRLRIHIQRRATVEVLHAIGARWKIELRIDRKCRVSALQWPGDICVIRVVDRVGPEIVVLRLEAVDQRLVAGEVDCLVDVVGVCRRGHEEIRGIIRAGKL